MSNEIFELIEHDEATTNYFIGDAKKPAISINCGLFSPKAKATLYFGCGILAEKHTSLKDAEKSAMNILHKTTKEIEVRIISPNKEAKILHMYPNPNPPARTRDAIRQSRMRPFRKAE